MIKTMILKIGQKRYDIDNLEENDNNISKNKDNDCEN